MGIPSHNNKGKRGHKLSYKSARRTKSSLAPPDLMWKAYHAKPEPKASVTLPLDEDLPGLGQFYCDVTGRHFENAAALATHVRCKAYKKALKMLSGVQAPHSQQDAEAAAGIALPDHGRKLRG